MRSKDRGIIVLGMHRSGTSLLIGLLELAGLDLGEVTTKQTRQKPTGTKENKHFRALNNQILAFFGCRWDQLQRPIDPSLFPPEKLKGFLSTLQATPGQWALKDPRTLLTYPVWQNALPPHNLIGTFRNPLQVAASLNKKSGVDFNHALDLWCVYNKSLLDQYSNQPFPVLNFDLPQMEYYYCLSKALKTFGLNLTYEAFNDFYKARPLRKENSDLSIHPQTNLVYKRLLAIASSSKEW